jgi:phage terminase small subunit
MGGVHGSCYIFGGGGIPVTAKQRRFADEYLIDLNATRAYKVAYPGVKRDETARVNGSRLLTNANVRAYVDEQLERISNARVADAREVMEYLTSVMRGQSKAPVVVIEGEGDGVSTARAMDKPPDERERLKAAELVGKRYGLFKENLNLDGALSVVFAGEGELAD